MINTGFLTFVWRELKRFLSLYNQTLVPGLLTTVLYVVVFGKSLGGRIGEIKEVPYMSFIIPGPGDDERDHQCLLQQCFQPVSGQDHEIPG
ncbi:MAG: hypothetical protein JSW54_13395 [Fidelibacterota bacterium]|nr:MAG: hypothetical protein JSW54_13395 [Candidatus Neomarinimicrobiota bacterium]